MDTLEELFGLDASSAESLRADFLVEADMNLLDRLVDIRTGRGLSQRDVGAIMGVSQPTVAQFEGHDSNPRLSTIRRYAMAVGALISHQVVPDEGQLADGLWRQGLLDTDLSWTVSPQPSHPLSISVSLGAAQFRDVDTMGRCAQRAGFALAA